MKGGVTKVLTAFLELAPGVFQFFHVTIEFFDVLFSLFGTQPLSFGARVLCFCPFALRPLRLGSRHSDIFEVFLVGEIDDGNNRKRREDSVKTDRRLKLHNATSNKR